MQFPVRLANIVFCAAAALALVSCGGGSGDGAPLMAPQSAVDQSTCFQSAGSAEKGYHFVGGVCTKTFAPMYTEATALKQPKAPQSAQSAQLPQAQPVYTWAQLLAWAEATYPQYFRGGTQNGFYGEYTYRYYPSTGNYLGLRTGTDMVYVMGTVTDDDLLYIGTLSALSCQVYPANCITTTPSAPSAPSMAQYPAVASWATGSYPQHFAGSSQDGVEDGYAYRYYPATGNYVAVKNGRVYVLGPVSGGVLRDAGTVAAPSLGSTAGTGGSASGADVPGNALTTARLQVGTPVAGAIDQAGDTDWYAITLAAGTAYTFELSGMSGGGGTLSDPILRLLNASGQEITRNDDISYPSNIDSRITYTPTSGGTYYLSAQAYGTLAGTYRLSASGGASSGTGGTGSTGGTGGTGSTGSTGGTGSGSSGGGVVIAPQVSWSLSVSQAFDTYVLQLCYGGSGSCTGLGAPVTRDRNLNDGITTSGNANGIRWTPTSPVTQAQITAVGTSVRNIIRDLWAGGNVPPNATMMSILNTALANATSPADVETRARAAFTSRGYLSSGGSSGTGGTGGSGTGGTTGGGVAAACSLDNYRGPNDVTQMDYLCKNAYINKCFDQYTGTSDYAAQTVVVCNTLDGFARAVVPSTTARAYCSYCN